MSEVAPKAPGETVDIKTTKNQKIIMAILKARDGAIYDYQKSIAHTRQGFLISSMVYAYSKGLNDLFKILTKELYNEESAEKNQEGQ